jgi:hypothetical protein
VTVVGLCACSQVEIVENTSQAVSVHYGGMKKLKDATAVADQVCGKYGKTAHLRSTEDIGIAQHSAHFDCV